MQVILIKDVDRLGRKGEVKNVTEGHAKNFLFPQRLAVPFTEGTQKYIKLLQKSWQLKIEKEKDELKQLAEKINGITVKVHKKAGEKGKLYGSVTNLEIAEAIKEKNGVEIDRKFIQIDHIKELGEHEVVAKFSSDIKATFKVIVLPENATQEEVALSTQSKSAEEQVKESKKSKDSGKSTASKEIKDKEIKESKEAKSTRGSDKDIPKENTSKSTKKK